MNFLVLSDTHLQNDLFQQITERYPFMDAYIHCGDSSLKQDDPLLEKYYVVKGNHDFENFNTNIIFKKNQYNFLITHGQYFNVFQGNSTIYNYMVEHDIDICFHGHSHIPAFSKINNKYIINPGSVMINRGSYGFGTFAIVSIDDHVNVRYYNSETFEECTNQVLEDGRIVLEEYKNILKQK